MASTPSPELMTADELERMPDDGKLYELVQGRLTEVSPSSSKPVVVAFSLGSSINAFVREQRLGICGGADWGFRLAANPDTVRAPDVGFVRAERIPAEGIPRGFWPGAPDLAVEVLSPPDRWTEVLRKVADYLEADTSLVWVLNPDARRTVAFRADGSVTGLGEDGVLDGEHVLPGFRLSLTEVWV